MLPSLGPFTATNNNATYRRNRRRGRLAPCTGTHEIYETNEYSRPAPFAVSLIRGRSTVTTHVHSGPNSLPYTRSRLRCSTTDRIYARASLIASHKTFFTWRNSPPVGQGLLMHEVSRSHITTHHSRYDFSGRVISPPQRRLPGNTQHSQQTSMPLVGFEPTIAAGQRPQTYASDRTATGTDSHVSYDTKQYLDCTFQKFRNCCACVLMVKDEPRFKNEGE
jgi:hypothetical protein